MDNAIALPAFAASPITPVGQRTTATPLAVRPKATPCAFTPIHHAVPLRATTPPPSLMRGPRTTAAFRATDGLRTQGGSPNTTPFATPLSTPNGSPLTLPDLTGASTAVLEPDTQTVSRLERLESFLTELLENPEYRDLAKTAIANGAALIELGRFLNKALQDFKLASTLTGGGIMAVVVGVALIISGGQIAQKIPGSSAAMKAKTDFCVKQVKAEIAAAQSQVGVGATQYAPLTEGSPEFDEAVQSCVQALRTIPSDNKLTLSAFRDFVTDVLMHVQNVIALFHKPSPAAQTA